MDSSIEHQFYRFLLEQRDYPPDSILVQHYLPRNWGSAKYIPDFTIVDPLTRDILGVIEIKSASAVERGDTIERCQRLSKGLGTRRIHFFLVFFDENSPERSAHHRFVFGEEQEFQQELFPTFAALATGGRAAAIEETKEARKGSIGAFQSVCYLLAVALIVALVLDFLEVIDWTQPRILLLGAAVALIIIPHATKLKILGVEFERYIKK